MNVILSRTTVQQPLSKGKNWTAFIPNNCPISSGSTNDITQSVQLPMIWIPAGTFEMENTYRVRTYANEELLHTVTLSHGY